MNIYGQIQSLDPGTEATITLRGTIRDGGGSHVLEFGGFHRLSTSLMHAESITVHEPAIKWQIGDVVQGAAGVTLVRDQDGKWRTPSGDSALVTDKSAHTYTPVIREGKIVAQSESDPDRPAMIERPTWRQVSDLLMAECRWLDDGNAVEMADALAAAGFCGPREEDQS